MVFRKWEYRDRRGMVMYQLYCFQCGWLPYHTRSYFDRMPCKRHGYSITEWVPVDCVFVMEEW